MRLGFTGSSSGATHAQLGKLLRIFADLDPGDDAEFHHGMCVGADAAAHAMARSWGWPIVGHPGVDKHGGSPKRAPLPLLEFTEIRVAWPYLKRNRDIVRESDWLIALPDGPEKRRSGTWATVRYARKAGVPVTVVMPDGKLLEYLP